jgi:hypothetical protein
VGTILPDPSEEVVARVCIDVAEMHLTDRKRQTEAVAGVIRRLREAWEAKTEAKIRQAIEQRARAEALLLSIYQQSTAEVDASFDETPLEEYLKERGLM